MRQIIRVTPLEDTAIRFDSIFLAAVNVLCNGMDSQQEKGPGGVCFSLVNIPINDIRFCTGLFMQLCYRLFEANRKGPSSSDLVF